mgnify:CR=1 FL=1
MKIEIKLDELISIDPNQFDHQVADKLRKKRGLYFLMDEDSQILYIGQSINIGSRLVSHFCNSSMFETSRYLIKLIGVLYMNSPKKLKSTEKYLIQKYSPPFNSEFLDDHKMLEIEKENARLNSEILHLKHQNEALKSKSIQLSNQLNHYSPKYGVYFSREDLDVLKIDDSYKFMNIYFENEEQYDDFIEGISLVLKERKKYRVLVNEIKEKLEKELGNTDMIGAKK